MSVPLAEPAESVRADELTRRLRRDPVDQQARKALADHYRLVGGPYQMRDWAVVDYGLSRYDFSDRLYRAQSIQGSSGYFVVVGSAASFGATSPITYADLLADRLGLTAVNLGQAGAGFKFYLNWLHADFQSVIDGAEFVIVEIMSPRSLSNSRFRLSDGLASAFDLHDGGRVVRPLQVYQRLAQSGHWDEFHALREENEAIYLRQIAEFLGRLRVPSVVTYFSRAAPEDRVIVDSPGWIRAGQVFPHFVTNDLFARIELAHGQVCRAITKDGVSLAIDRFTFQPTKWWNGRNDQTYYPNPMQHINAARQIARELAARGLGLRL